MAEIFNESDFSDTLSESDFADSVASPAPVAQPAQQGLILPGMISPGMPVPNPQAEHLVKSAMSSPAFLPVAGSLAAGIASGGLSLPAQAAATGLAAAAGTAFSQAQKGGESSIGSGLAKTAETGLEAAATSLGVGLGVAGLAKAAPYAISYLSEVPVPVIKRVVERGLKIIGVGSRNAEVSGAIALKETQDAINAARTEAGIEVRDSLIGLHKAVKGQRVVDLTPVRDALQQTMAEAHAADPRVMAAGEDSVLGKLKAISKAIGDKPNASPAEAVAIRRKIDDFITWARKPLAEPISDLSQRSAKAMRTALAQSLDDAGKAANYTRLSDANAKFHAIDDAIDNAEVVFRTPNQSDYGLARRFVTLAKEWSRDGGQAQAIENVGKAIPQANGPIQRLIDNAAVREIVQAKPSNTLEWGKVDKALRIMSKYLPAAAGPASKAGAVTKAIVPAAVSGARK